jgi:hypothetical protein
MKFFTSLFLIAALGFASCLYLPWWTIAITSFVVILFIPQKPVHAFFAGFLGIFILWSALAFYISIKNDHILAHKISVLIFKTDSPLLLVLVSGLIGGLVAGLAALSASYSRRLSSAI